MTRRWPFLVLALDEHRAEVFKDQGLKGVFYVNDDPNVKSRFGIPTP